jgi:O-acetyl-ADP-ribose deacetylase (regulator of RNase III)
VGRTAVRILQGDITELEVDAITNAANEQLKLGGGVAGAIARKGGPEIQEACDRIGYTPVGTAVLTPAGRLKARYVIHAVGPRYGVDPDPERLLASAVRATLELAEQHALRRIALPAISTGIFGFPREPALRIILQTIRDYLASRPDTVLEEVILCLYEADSYALARQIWAEMTTSDSEEG